MRTLLTLMEVVGLLYAPLAVAVTLSKRRAAAHGVDPNPAYPGEQPGISAGAVTIGVLTGVALLVVLSGQIAAFNDWVLSLGFY